MSSVDDNFVEMIKQDGLVFMSHVCEEIPGTEIYLNHKNLDVYNNWGKALAILHRESANYQPGSHLSYLIWQDLIKETGKYVPFKKREIRNIYQDIQQCLTSQSVTSENFGLIHGDMRDANVICDGNNIHFINFDEPVYHWWTQDIARAFLNTVDKDISKWQAPFVHFIIGYRSVKPLTAEQLQQIPWLIRYKTIEMYLWTKHNWHDPIAPGGGSTESWLNEMLNNILDPNWLRALDNLIQKDI